MSFDQRLREHREAGRCDCLDHLREVGLTPPRERLGEFRVSGAFRQQVERPEADE